MLSCLLQDAPRGAVVRLTISIFLPDNQPNSLLQVVQDGLLLAIEGVRLRASAISARAQQKVGCTLASIWMI
jgi:hypothetical protein